MAELEVFGTQQKKELPKQLKVKNQPIPQKTKIKIACIALLILAFCVALLFLALFIAHQNGLTCGKNCKRCDEPPFLGSTKNVLKCLEC